MSRARHRERLLSRALEAAILVLVVLVSMQVLSKRDPFECRAEGRRLSDEDLARESVAFLRGEQVDNVLTPLKVPDGFDTFDVDTLFADSRFGFDITRDGDGPGDVLKPHRSWPMRQMFGARLAVSLTLQADPPDARMLRAVHVSDPCGKVLVDWGHISSVATPAMLPAGTE